MAKRSETDIQSDAPPAALKDPNPAAAGLSNKLRVALANVMPNSMLAEQHRKMAEPGTAKH